VLVLLGIVVSTILKNYINKIPEKKKTFLQKFLSDTIARNIIIIGGAFLILKFIVDPLFNFIFPAIAIGGSLIGGNDNDDQKDIEINTNNNVENNNVNDNLANIEPLPSFPEHISSTQRNERRQNELDNLSRPSFMEPLQTGPSFIENDDEKTAEIFENINVNNNDEEKTAEISENTNINNVNNNEELTTENINVNNNDDEKTAEISENINVNNNEELTTEPINQSRPSFMEPLPTRPSFIENENNIVLFPEEEKNQENVEDNNINNDEEKDNPQTGGKKKIGRPKKIKSAAKVKLGKTNKWAIAVKRARKALGLTGFVPLSKGGVFYKTAKSFYYELTH
jgi:hypothetical protein